MLAQNVNATKKNRKPPAGLDTHMLGNRLAAAAGVGKRGADSKASTAGFPSSYLLSSLIISTLYLNTR